MSDYENTWKRLVQTARQAPHAPRTEAPHGFATRVVARWQDHPMPSLFSVWKMLSARVLALGCLIMLLSLAASYGVIRETWLTPQPDVSWQVVDMAGSQIEEVWTP